jgi:putative phage-type endonuclease
MLAEYQILDLEQGTPEWLALRKTKVTATDACVLMGSNPWKTPLQLYNEKISNNPPKPPNAAMQRGLDLEPIARELFMIKSGIKVSPKVVVKDWAMASLDGMSECRKYIVEIKCPGEKDHAIALSGNIPDHYYPQLQYQMYICNVEEMFYFSFDGVDGVIINVKRDYTGYIGQMIHNGMDFYERLINRAPPDPTEKDYIERNDEIWKETVLKWKLLAESEKELEKKKEELRKELIFLSGESNTKGSGLSLCQVTRVGMINYSKIECLQEMDLEPYRKPPSTSWRITCR